MPTICDKQWTFFKLNLNFHFLFERLKFRLKLKFNKHSSLFLEVLALVLVGTAHPATAWLAGSTKRRPPVVAIQVLPVWVKSQFPLTVLDSS